MKRLEFEDYEELICDIVDTYDSIDDKYGCVSIIAKYNDAKEIIRELFCIEYDIASIEFHREEIENYYDEYIISLNFEGIWCEKFKRDDEYITDESDVTYVMDNCSSAVFSHCKSKNIYEVSIDVSNENNDILEDNKEYISENNNANIYDSSSSSIIFKINVDTDELEKFFEEDMKKKIKRAKDIDNLINILHRPYLYLYEYLLP